MTSAKVIIPVVVICLIVIGYVMMSKKSAEKKRVVNEVVSQYKEVIDRHSEEMKKFTPTSRMSDEQKNLAKEHRVELQNLRNKIRSDTGLSVGAWKNPKFVKGIRWAVYVKNQLPRDVKWTFIPN